MNTMTIGKKWVYGLGAAVGLIVLLLIGAVGGVMIYGAYADYQQLRVNVSTIIQLLNYNVQSGKLGVLPAQAPAAPPAAPAPAPVAAPTPAPTPAPPTDAPPKR